MGSAPGWKPARNSDYIRGIALVGGFPGNSRCQFRWREYERQSPVPEREKDADGKDKPNKVTDGPYLFRTGTGRLGMIWTSWIYNVYTQGVAYSESGTLDGPWIQEKDPITPPNFGHGMLFQTLDGKWLMSVHSHKDVNGRYIRIPHLFEVDFSRDKLVVGKPYIP